ncbi:hypothetical protein [Anaerotignum sp.]|uniref:hypothetical protein n=1 Tax=Anaerotignum sp. TaxID=2039241 RepID=UPI00289EA669|nr:hypothetical protein [Anaerotignum sp.]
MKQTLIGMCCLILSLALVACGSDFANSSTSFYSNYTAMEKNDKYEISGKCLVVNTLNIVYISSLEDNTVDLSGELKGISDDVKIVYINSDNKETVISDSNKNGEKGKLQLNTTINLEKGDSRIEFRGKKSTFKFNLSFFNIDKDKIEYFSAEKEEDELEEENFIDDEMESLDFEDKDNNKKDSDKLLDEITLSFTDKDDSSTILNTSLDKDTKVKVLL